MYRDQDQRNFARNLRLQPTEPEKRLWYFLCSGKLGVKFRRQAAIGEYIVDFVCFSNGLVVESDGPQHLEPQGKTHDDRRSDWLVSRGLRAIRFRNHELDEDIRQVVAEIQRNLKELEGTSRPSPTLPARGRGPNE